MTNLPALREAVAKGMKLLEALAEPHEQPDGDDHAWRTCRRCLALEEGETEHAWQLFRALLDELEAEREKHDEGAYDDMKAAKDKAEADLAALKVRARTCDTCQFQRDDEHVGEPCCTISLTWIPCRVLGNRCGAWAKK